MAFTLPQSADDVTPSIVLVGVPSEKALQRVITKLNLNNIDFSAFYEPDNDMGLSAVATVPLTEGQRAALGNYKLWNESQFLLAHSSAVRAPSSQEDGGRLFESGCANHGQVGNAMQEV